MFAFHRRLGRTALISLLLAAAFALASPAHAAVVDVTCDELQTALDGADGVGGADGTGNGENDVITLTEVCNDQSFTIPSNSSPNETDTLQGNGTSGFDGGATGQRILSGTSIGNYVIQDLFFQNGNYSGSGGAIKVRGQFAVTLQRVTFTNNDAGQTGGAVYLRLDQQMAPPVNGLGAAVNGLPDINLHDNDFSQNEAAVSGGALHVETNDQSQLNLSSNQFLGNDVATDANEPPVQSHFGGGAFIESSALPVEGERQDAETGTTLTQSNNLFDGNFIAQFAGGGSYFGGGEWISGVDTSSVNDQFINNTLAGQPLDVTSESEGGGLGFESDNRVSSTLSGVNFVSAGNTIEGVGNGGGVYVGGDTPTTFNLLQGTVSGNEITNNQGDNPGIGGNGNDNLHLKNSIVQGNTLAGQVVQPEIGGFDTDNTVTAFNSDVCDGNGNPLIPGQGNICAAPKLVNPAPGTGNVHETGQSPTIDKGNDGFLGGLQTDYEGGPRSTDGDGDGHTVDMGADEGPGAPVAGVAGVTLAGPVSPAAVPTCGRRDISLVRADVRGRRVVLNGLVSARLAGQTVGIFANYTRRRLATVKSNAAGQFTVRVRRPSRKVFDRTLYQARVGAIRSIRLKLPQFLASRSISAQGNQITLRGRVKRSVLGRRNTVTIKRLICGRYRTVGQARPDRQGNYVARFSVPAGLTSALFRAETRVLRKRGGRVYVKQYGRAISITLTGQTG